MNKSPKLSIITPSYNQSEFLERTIKSVIEQNYNNLEYIIIDGGSSDNSLSIIKKYSDQLAYWVSEPDNGQANAVNKGFDFSTGDIIGWINSDDTYLPGTFKIIIETFNKFPGIDVVYGDYFFIDNNDNILLKKKEIRADFNIILFARNTICQPTVFFRREVLKKVGKLTEDIHYGMDWDYWFRISNSGFKFKQIKNYLATFRWQGNSKSVTNPNAALQERRSLQYQYAKKTWLKTPDFLIPGIIHFLDIFYRLKWHILKLITRRSLDFFKQRIILNRNKY